MEYILVCITILVSVFMITFTNYKKIKLDELKLYESIDFDSKHELLNKIIDDEIKNTNIRINGILPPKLNIDVPKIIAAILPLKLKELFL